MTEVDVDESVFEHCNYEGYWVIRCNDAGCHNFRFTEPPLCYRRAVKHFEKVHSEDFPPRKGLTDSDVFAKFAFRGKQRYS